MSYRLHETPTRGPLFPVEESPPAPEAGTPWPPDGETCVTRNSGHAGAQRSSRRSRATGRCVVDLEPTQLGIAN